MTNLHPLQPSAEPSVEAACPSATAAPDGWAQLDTVRLMLASIVVISHGLEVFLQPFGHLPVWGPKLASVSSEWAVHSFFLISGMVIGRSLVASAKANEVFFPWFMLRRLWRIYPPLLLSIAVCVAYAIILKATGHEQYAGPANEPIRKAFVYLDYIYEVAVALASFGFRGSLHGDSNGPLWSLVLEMQAYVIAGLIFQTVYARALVVRIVAALATVFAFYFRGLHVGNSIHLIGFIAFGAGVLLSLLKVRLPVLLPRVPLECSYSLYILHFPTMLFVFFLCMPGQAGSLLFCSSILAFALFTSVALSVASGLTAERIRGRWFR